MKLALVWISLGIIWYGVMKSGDASGFYSSTCVMYAMLLLDYYNYQKQFKHRILNVARGIMIFLSVFSAFGVFGVLSIKEKNNQLYIAFADSMRLNEAEIINIHFFIISLGVLAIIMSALELVFLSDKDNESKPKKGKLTIGKVG
ncbi:hypothetical protein JNUCC23_09500 [Peribacillus sp. JNUCC 23]